MKFTSHAPTDRLLLLRVTDPPLAEQIEGLCIAIRALKPYAERQESEHVLAYANRQIQPWIEPGDAFRQAMKDKASSAQATAAILKRHRREPAE